MKCCPLKECGRKFDNEETMLEHVKRRHPMQYESIRSALTKSIIETEHAQQQELNKLPKLQKIMSRQKKTLQIHRRSSSKTNKPGDTSSIIQQSRQIVNTSGIAARRPSLKNKHSQKDLKNQKLPAITTNPNKRSAALLTTNQTQVLPSKKNSANDDAKGFYTTAPNFNRPALKVRSRQKNKSKQSINKVSQSMIEQKTERKLLQLSQVQIGEKDKKKSLGFFRPSKKIGERRPMSKQKIELNQQEKQREGTENYDDYNFDERIVVIKKWGSKTFICPSQARVQNLFINHCGLTTILLNDLASLIQLSVTHNNLVDTQFLKYQRNANIKYLHLDYNLITDIYVPPRLKVITASFNKLQKQHLESLCDSLQKAPELEEVDFSFNGVRKGSNYKLKILSGNPKLKNIDGLKVTKIDREMMEEFRKIQAEEQGLIPLAHQYKDRPMTAATAANSQVSQDIKNIQQLQTQCKGYESKIRHTQEQLSIIEQQNEIISSQLTALNQSIEQLKLDDVSLGLFEKLKKQVQCLQLLNFLAFADEEQLVAMISKKRGQITADGQ